MKKLLWVGDAVVASGFARVTHEVLDNLTDDFEIHVLGVNYTGDPHEYDYSIWPARLGGDLLGLNRLLPLIEKLKPDTIVLFNDIWVITQYLDRLQDFEGRIVIYFPVDSRGYQAEWIKKIKVADSVIVYTEFAKTVLEDAGYRGEVIVIPHGVDPERFFYIEQKEARKVLPSIGKDDYVVFNGNRNQPRKRIDLTIKGFCIFAEEHPNARLYLHMGLKDVGWNLIQLMQRECENHGLVTGDRLIITNPNLSPSSAVSVEQLNIIYNVCDVGINTSLGEGWGLVNFEQAACKVPQILTDYSANAEVFKDAAFMLPVRQYLTATGINTEGGLVHEDDVAEALELAYTNKELATSYADKMANRLKAPKYNWKVIAEQFKQEL